jgi:hypothetical protein
MKDYYKILGLRENASEEEIRARWIKLMRKFHPDQRIGRKGKDERVREINEAYDALKHSSTRVKYDLERAYGRKKGRFYTKKLVIPLSLVIIPLILGSIYLYVKMPQVPSLSKRITQSETNQTNLSREMRSVFHWDETNETNQIASKKVEKVVPQEMVQIVPPIIEPPLGSPIRAEGELRPKEKQSAQAVSRSEVAGEIAKVVPKKVERKASIPSSSASGEELRSREKPSTQTILQSEMPVATEKVVPKEMGKVVPQEIARIVPQTDETHPKDSAALGSRDSIDGTTPKRIDSVDAKDAMDSTMQLTQKRSDARDAKSQGTQLTQPPDGPSDRISAKSLIAKEEEVRRFFATYIERYIQKDLDGFLSTFSSKAVQNQKEKFDEIRKIYAGFFDQSQKIHYQLEDMKIEIYQNIVEVKARYEVDQTLKKREEKKVWRGPIRWTLVKEQGTLKIISIDYVHQKDS